ARVGPRWGGRWGAQCWRDGCEPVPRAAVVPASDPPPPASAEIAPQDEPLPEQESIDPVIVTPRPGSAAGGPAKRRGLVILQIGDSHTSADFLTGELRRRLQVRYGRGGPGYITAGKPHIGVRSPSLQISVSSGWSYRSLQAPE